MPKEETTLPVNYRDKATILATAYSAFKDLGWEIQFAGEDKILGHTPRNWKTYGETIIAGATDNELSISSELHESASFDLMKKNKKNVAAFTNAFNTAKESISPAVITQNIAAISALQETTVKVAAQEIRQAEAVDKVMNLSKSNLYATYGIVAINIVMFILMVVNGVAFLQPTTIDILKWGADYAPLTFSGEWWRVISSMFIHIGIIHILMNMYALYIVGSYLEPMLGKLRYLVAYLCTGVFAGLVSLWWHQDPVASAGASGAIFGIYGVFLALLSTNLIPAQVRNNLLKSIGIFVLYNLVYGMKSGVDNSAHIGGLISGLVIGYIYYLTLKGEQAIKKIQIITAVIALVTVGMTYTYLEKMRAEQPANLKAEVLQEINDAQFKDADRYREKLKTFGEAEAAALKPFNDTTLSRVGFAEQLMHTAVPQWQKAKQATTEMQSLNISDKMKQRAIALYEYVALRIQETELLIKINSEPVNNYKVEQEAVAAKLNAVLERLK